MYNKRPLFWIFESARFVDCTTFELCYYSIDNATLNSRAFFCAMLICNVRSFSVCRSITTLIRIG